eukprot:351228-Chlamydomonas_euryale.AAC.1
MQMIVILEGIRQQLFDNKLSNTSVKTNVQSSATAERASEQDPGSAGTVQRDSTKVPQGLMGQALSEPESCQNTRQNAECSDDCTSRNHGRECCLVALDGSALRVRGDTSLPNTTTHHSVALPETISPTELARKNFARGFWYLDDATAM